MALETELKLSLPARSNAAFRRLLAAQVPAPNPPTIKYLTSIYFDTPSFALARRDMALRLREIDGQWFQTLKLPEQAGAGLYQRGELEVAVKEQVLELKRIDDRAARKLLTKKAIASALTPLFTTQIKRTQWDLLTANGDRLEIVLDEGCIRCGRRSEKINEIEIELKRGSAASLFSLALDWCKSLTMIPDARSKAARGYALFLQQPHQPAKAAIPQLHAALAPRAALHAAILECLRHLQANVPGVLASDDIEFVHQARVALRRLRSAQKAFTTLTADGAWQSMTVDIQWLATLLGNVRDLDVLLTETLPPIEAALQRHAKFSAIKKALSMQRKRHRAELCAALRSARFGQLLLRLLQWLHDDSEKPVQKKSGLRHYSQRSLQQRWQQLDRLARRWQSLNDEQRHDLRKRAKKLRYAAEFFSPLYQPKAVANYLQALQTTQQILGMINDCATAQTLLKQLIEQTPVLAPAADLAIGWLACKAQELDTELDRDIKSLETAKIFWRS